MREALQGRDLDGWNSGKAHHHAGNVQALSAPDGLPLWVSDVEPGSVHDLATARAHLLGALYAAAANELPALADGGYEGVEIGVLTPIRQPDRSVTCTDMLRSTYRHTHTAV